MSNAYLVIQRDAGGHETFGIRAFANPFKAHIHACKAAQHVWGDTVTLTIENDDDRDLAIDLNYVNGGYCDFWTAPWTEEEKAAFLGWPSLESLGIDTTEARQKRWMDSIFHDVPDEGL